MVSFEDNLKTVVGNFVLQSIQFQTLANQLQEKLTEAEAKIASLEAAAEGPKLVKPLKKE